MFYRLILITKDTFLTTVSVTLCKTIFDENYSFLKVPSKYLMFLRHMDYDRLKVVPKISNRSDTTQIGDEEAHAMVSFPHI
jgi:hypothetical protein